MPAITDDINSPAKILLIGKSGAGKTGSLASLVTSGYNLRIIDTDKGVRSLRSLLTDPHYPYSAIIAKKKIDLNLAVRYIPIDTAMRLKLVTRRAGEGKSTSETLLAPADAKAWDKVLDTIDNWKDGDVNLGSIRTWTTQDILVFDSISTLSMCAFYLSQAINGRLGARENGYDYMHDIKEAQASVRRLLELIYDSNVGCNVICISHITWVDESKGVASRPGGDMNRDNQSFVSMSSPDGYPSAIGRALSPNMGKYFNDVYIVRSDGSGANVKRTISTVPQEGVIAKNSVYLERDYPIASGMAEIFSALRSQSPPTDLMEATKKRVEAPSIASSGMDQVVSAPAPARH